MTALVLVEAMASCGLRRCRTCLVFKDVSLFTVHLDKRTGKRYTHHDCKPCAAAKRRERYAMDPELRKRIQESNRAGQLRDLYDLTPEQYWTMHREQDGLCWLCREPERDGRLLPVDHSHVTGKVRGLLCTSCNRRLGFVERFGIERIWEYLRRGY